MGTALLKAPPVTCSVPLGQAGEAEREHSKIPLNNMGLSQDPNFQKLQEWYTAHSLNLNLRHMFEADKERFNKFRYALDPIKSILWRKITAPRIMVDMSNVNAL